MIKNVCLALGVVSAMGHHHHHHAHPHHELIALQDDPICGSGGCETTLPAPEKSHPIDYKVPNFGVDTDIKDNKNSLNAAEEQRNHHWNFEFCEEGKPCNPALWTKYNFKPELSEDVKATEESIGQAEDTIGHELTVNDVRFVDDQYTYAS
tara:strand:+ start:57 stop:509 length:453 start_codon:yes stop_codon:yes gene_type:complete